MHFIESLLTMWEIKEYIGNKEINSISYTFPNIPESSKEKYTDSDDTEVYTTLPGGETSFLSLSFNNRLWIPV